MIPPPDIFAPVGAPDIGILPVKKFLMAGVVLLADPDPSHGALAALPALPDGRTASSRGAPQL